MISMAVLWVVREGTGLARALNFTTTIASSTSTNSAMAAISQSRKSWNQTMSSITGVRRLLQPEFPWRGLAEAGPGDTAGGE